MSLVSQPYPVSRPPTRLWKPAGSDTLYVLRCFVDFVLERTLSCLLPTQILSVYPSSLHIGSGPISTIALPGSASTYNTDDTWGSSSHTLQTPSSNGAESPHAVPFPEAGNDDVSDSENPFEASFRSCV